MPATTNRDLASVDIWQRSLVHSQRRRELAAAARKDISRKKSASLAISAAMAASPAWPSVAGTVDLSAGDAHELANKNRKDGKDRVLLSHGDESSAVAAVQRVLQIPDDGIFGPQTEGAVKDFQKREHIRPSGEVDIRTWLKMFPNDAIVFAPASAAKANGFGDGQGSQWAAVRTAESNGNGGDLAAGVANASTGAEKASSAKRSRASGGDVLGAQVAQAGDVLPPDDGTTPESLPLDGIPAPDVPAPVDPDPTAPYAPGGGTTAPEGTPEPEAPSFQNPGGTVGQVIQSMMAKANEIDNKRYPYSWGGGHNPSFSGPYDCSGAVSAVLKAGGLLKSPMVSGGFTNWGAPGKGAVTIYANSGHVYMSIMGKFFGTSRANPAGGAGWFNGAPRPGFAVVHVPFERMRLKDERAARKKRAIKRQRRYKRQRRLQQQQQQQQGGYVTPGPNGGLTYTPPPSSSPTGPGYSPPPQEQAPQPGPAPAPVPAPVPPDQGTVPPAPAPAEPAPAQPGPGTGTPAPGTPTGSPAPSEAPAATQSPTPAPAPVEQPAQTTPAPTAPSAPADTAQQPAAPAPSAPAETPATGAGEGAGTPAAEGAGPATSTPQTGSSGSGEGASGKGASGKGASGKRLGPGLRFGPERLGS